MENAHGHSNSFSSNGILDSRKPSFDVGAVTPSPKPKRVSRFSSLRTSKFTNQLDETTLNVLVMNDMMKSAASVCLNSKEEDHKDEAGSVRIGSEDDDDSGSSSGSSSSSGSDPSSDEKTEKEQHSNNSDKKQPQQGMSSPPKKGHVVASPRPQRRLDDADEEASTSSSSSNSNHNNNNKDELNSSQRDRSKDADHNNKNSEGSTGSTQTSSSSSSSTSTDEDDDKSEHSSSSSPAKKKDKKIGRSEEPVIPPIESPMEPLHNEEFWVADSRAHNLEYLNVLSEAAVVYEWQVQGGTWQPRSTRIAVAPHPFSKGAMRSSFLLIDLQCPMKVFVAKKYRKNVEPQQYFVDAAMHCLANHWATVFNQHGPPKLVRFVPAAVLELPSRRQNHSCSSSSGVEVRQKFPACDSSSFLLAMEPYLRGQFKKHNNNYGYVNDEVRCTPHAFSHFTYHYSCGELMIVDIQGVGDNYTDPQILTWDGEEHGKGNLGRKGMRRFFRSHRCNAVCAHLKLPEMLRSSTSAAEDLTPCTVVVERRIQGGFQQLPSLSRSDSAMAHFLQQPQVQQLPAPPIQYYQQPLLPRLMNKFAELWALKPSNR